jgi:pilus assembly protein Flp/PilA
MSTILLGLYVKFENLISREDGQDLVEYAMVLTMIALLSIASMRAVASSISSEFSMIESVFSSAIQ